MNSSQYQKKSVKNRPVDLWLPSQFEKRGLAKRRAEREHCQSQSLILLAFPCPRGYKCRSHRLDVSKSFVSLPLMATTLALGILQHNQRLCHQNQEEAMKLLALLSKRIA
ncbi:hypothetical protein GOP47_0020810 [Adiantum capillus-veneris]|uniref:Uncharacterized protein n=1 Tax=Adiantum capillus-veneris TaxID=13818 RepID=A0A9D4UAE3_ADICA|nr:hypothetical protein GOP47_0030538 [Adiantum capillus-veneris]KAI5064140.1 hypothetical protein GOP47_0020810 [Adiantum capillus-veneris]